MSIENQTSESLTAPVSIHIECEGGCSPSHRRLRRTLTAVVLVLVAAIVALLVYLALTGGFSRG